MAGEYKQLSNHLVGAYHQASKGKGKERHAEEATPFEQQPICTIGRMLGSYDFELGQAIKKLSEVKRIHHLKGACPAIAEIYGAINYAAAACILIQESIEDKKEWA